MRSDHAVVLEFYTPGCRHCRGTARSLRSVAAAHPAVDWVMVDAGDAKNRDLWESYGVTKLPHFSYLDASKHLVRTETGESGARRLAAAMDP